MIISSIISYGKNSNLLLEKVTAALYLSAQSGNLVKTSKRFYRQYPQLADAIKAYTEMKHDCIGKNLFDLSAAAEVFRKTRKAHPIKFSRIC